MFRAVQPLLACLRTIPGLAGTPQVGTTERGCWWVHFSIDLGHPLGRHALLRLAEAVNQVCVHERLPVLFYPVAPEAGQPRSLAWAFEAKELGVKPQVLATKLLELLPASETGWRNGARAPTA